MPAEQNVKYPGLPVVAGGTTYTMPPLCAADSRRYWSRIQAMQAGTEPDPLGLVADLVTACLRRNYPEVVPELVADFVDMDNIDELSSKCFGAGAFKRWAAMQAAAAAADAGNVRAPQPMTTPAGTGAPSTPPLPLPPAGDSPTSMS